jgi:Uncharacterized conserved protein
LKEKWELAYEDYLSGMKRKDIAAKYDVSVNTVKSWATRHKWSKKGAPQKKRVQTKKGASKIAEKMINENKELNEEHQLFCIYCLKYHNQVKAYMKVKPGVTYASACVGANRWMKDEDIQKEITRLKKELYTEALLDPQDIVQKYIDIAFMDTYELDGKAIRMADCMKALDWLSRHIGMATEEQKAKIELLRVQSSRIKSEMKKDDSKTGRKVMIINDLPK